MRYRKLTWAFINTCFDTSIGLDIYRGSNPCVIPIDAQCLHITMLSKSDAKNSLQSLVAPLPFAGVGGQLQPFQQMMMSQSN